MVELEQVAIAAVLLAVVGVGVYLAYRGYTNLTRGWTIWRNEPVDAGSVYLESGIVEVQGDAGQLEDQLLDARYTGQSVVAYDYKLEEKKRTRDADGNTDYEWRTVDSGTVAQPFYVTDKTGEVAVDPTGATISLDTERLSSGMSVESGTLSIGSRERKYEGRLEPGDPVHVYGQKREGDGPGGESVYIGDGEETDAFTVSDTTEFRTFLRYLAEGFGSLLLALAAFGVSGFLLLVLLEQWGIAEFAFVVLQP